MVWKCCVPGCLSGYVSKTLNIDSDRSSQLSFHSFPKDDCLRSKWLTAIHRKDCIVTANSRVCSKHFYESDFKEKCEDSNVSRAKNKTLILRRLKSDSFPKVFENQPSYLTVKETNHRSTSSSSSKRVELENRRYIELEENMLLAETITDFSDFEAKMSTCFVPCGYGIFKRKDFYSFV